MIQNIHYPIRPVYALQRYLRLVRTLKNWPAFIAYKDGWTGRGTFKAKTRSKLSFAVPWALKFAFKDIFLHEAYAKPFILAQIPPVPVVVDVGANAGFFSLSALHQRPRAKVYSVEALTANFELLECNQRRNPQTHWHVFHMAMAGKNGSIQIYSDQGNCLCTGASIVRPPGENSRNTATTYSESVRACTLETFFAQESIAVCDWLKIDCEGAEYEILYPSSSETLRRVRIISMEVDDLNAPHYNRPAMAEYLDRNGFDVFFADDAVLYAVNRANEK